MVARVGNPIRPLATIAGAPEPLPQATGLPPVHHDAAGNGAESRLWLQEPGRPTLWHIAHKRLAYSWYRMACGWEVRLPDAERVWPARGDEPQPATGARCRSCVQMQELTIQLDLGLGFDAPDAGGASQTITV